MMKVKLTSHRDAFALRWSPRRRLIDWIRHPVNWIRFKWINRHVPSSKQQVEQLGNFIMSDVPGEPSQSEGAVEIAIRLIKTHVPGVEKDVNYDKVSYGPYNEHEHSNE